MKRTAVVLVGFWLLVGAGGCSSGSSASKATAVSAAAVVTAVSATTIAAAATSTPETLPPITLAPVTLAPVTLAPITLAPVTLAPVTSAAVTVAVVDTSVPAATVVAPCDLATVVAQTETGFEGITPADLHCAADWAAWTGTANDPTALDGFFAVAQWNGSAWVLRNLGTAGVCGDGGVPADLWPALRCAE
jgi:hypothetical protein